MSASNCVCVRCHRELIKGGRVQIGILWGYDLILQGPIYWSQRVTAWPSIAVCGICALELADWLAMAPPPGQDDGEAAAEPRRGAAPRRRAKAEPRRAAARSGSALGSQK
jgi:hypothetical protein